MVSAGPIAAGLLKDRIADVPVFIEAVRQVTASGTVLDPKVVGPHAIDELYRSPVGRRMP